MVAGGRREREKEKKKNVYLKRSPRVALLLQVTFILMHYRSYPWILLVAESKENIFGEYVDFRVEIIVKNYRVFLIVSPLVGTIILFDY